ncbi:FAD-dependent oxidoreductase [Tunturiibacter gelidoferens]|uniref:Flavin-dependent monooxygenase n=1 Tax=Tunturiibacter gelidiferens TaxID=3069689 RepID=A0AAU7YXG8_9BACT
MNNPKIGIVGAGPGGLVAARILSLQGKDVTVFERESSFSDRTQGGSLDIHADAGQIALSKAGLMDEFQKIARYADQEARLYNKQGKLMHIDTNVANKDRPETDRGHLRGLLLKSLPVEIVRWGTHVIGVTPLPDRGCAVNFADGTSEQFDLIVGADGTWSRVRPLLSDVTPKYTGVLIIEFGIDNVDERYPDTAEMAGRGLTFALGDSKALVAHRDANAHLGGYIGLRVEENWFQANWLDKLDDAAVREFMCKQFAGWSDDLLLWIRRSEGKLVPRGIYELPAGHQWEHREGVTLLGDAAHVMSPFGGDGANLAMMDGADLAEALLQSDWRAAVAMFEHTMCARAEIPARGAGQAIQEVFSPRGLEHSLQWAHIVEGHHAANQE